MRVNDTLERSRFKAARLSRDARFDGHFFVAVKSTGIFCRPVCPARLPDEKNVDYYTQAASAMQDGFRPCLRCRPDAAPLSPAWRGVGSSVQRAQTLLSELPPQPVAGIAERMGMTGRYLHKLTTTHLGVAPKTFQLARQLLFAKQLLQQSNLPVAHVAQAAGFASSRQLQRQLQQAWQMTPSDLRKKTSTPVSVASGFDVTLPLYYRPPYDWSGVRAFLEKRCIHALETVAEHSYERRFTLDGKQGCVKAVHQPDHHRFRLTITLDDIRHLHMVVRNMARVLDVDANPGLIHQALCNAGIAKGIVMPGLRLPGVWSPFEACIRAVLGQQVSVTAAIRLLNQFVAHFQQDNMPSGFPEPSRVAEADLSWLPMPELRKAALQECARYFTTMEERVAAEQIINIKGIGRWTCDYVRLRGLSEPDCYLDSDLVVRKVAEKHQLAPEQASPWRSYLTLQLWALA